MYNNPIGAYEAVAKNTMPGREIEAAVLTRAARRLRECRDNWEGADRDEILTEALKFNQRIWSVFQYELMKEDNPLPKKLRVDLLRLSAFIDRKTFETMAFPAQEKLNIIIDINDNVAAGLRSSTG
jgi:flagellar protein FlaF